MSSTPKEDAAQSQQDIFVSAYQHQHNQHQRQQQHEPYELSHHLSDSHHQHDAGASPAMSQTQTHVHTQATTDLLADAAAAAAAAASAAGMTPLSPSIVGTVLDGINFNQHQHQHQSHSTQLHSQAQQLQAQRQQQQQQQQPQQPQQPQQQSADQDQQQYQNQNQQHQVPTPVTVSTAAANGPSDADTDALESNAVPIVPTPAVEVAVHPLSATDTAMHNLTFFANLTLDEVEVGYRPAEPGMENPNAHLDASNPNAGHRPIITNQGIPYAIRIRGVDSSEILYKALRGIVAKLKVRNYKNKRKDILLELVAARKLWGSEQKPPGYDYQPDQLVYLPAPAIPGSSSSSANPPAARPPSTTTALVSAPSPVPAQSSQRPQNYAIVPGQNAAAGGVFTPPSMALASAGPASGVKRRYQIMTTTNGGNATAVNPATNGSDFGDNFSVDSADPVDVDPGTPAASGNALAQKKLDALRLRKEYFALDTQMAERMTALRQELSQNAGMPEELKSDVLEEYSALKAKRRQLENDVLATNGNGLLSSENAEARGEIKAEI